LDTVFVNGKYRQSLERLSADTSVSKGDREQIRAFVRNYRDRIPEGWTYGQILESSKGIQKVRKESLELEVLSFQRKEEDILVQIFTELKVKNVGELAVEALYADVQIRDASGQLIHTSPPFLVRGPILVGESSQLLRLQYAYERPTGNALNDPKKAALRDTLNYLKAFSNEFDAKRMTLRVHEVLLEGGLLPEDHFLLPVEKHGQAGFPSTKSVGILDWAQQNKPTLEALASRDPSKYISVRPVLTDGFESQNGKFLLFDRRMKLVRFLTQEHQIFGRNIDPSLHPGKMEARHLVDFWGWPMELWVFSASR
jgi:hypothetical protein